MKTIVTRSPSGFTATDDAQRMLLRCILRDACEWHYTITGACPECRATGDICLPHWDGHAVPGAKYRDLSSCLTGCDGLPYGQASPLTFEHQKIIAAALHAAIKYRTRGESIEDVALMAAYREVQRQLNV